MRLRRPRWWRPTLRARLTIVYGGLFLVAGVVLVGLSYLLVRANLPELDNKLYVRLEKLGPGADQPVTLPDGRSATTGELLDTARQAVAQQRTDTLHSLLQWSAVALAVVAVAAIAVGWLVAGRALRPLHVITGTARRVADRSLHERIALDGPRDELKELADTFDDMLARLDRAFDGQRRFVANASHELRTPLAVNRTLLEVAMTDPAASPDLRQVGTSLLQVNERNERLIDGLLLLARSEQEVAVRRPVDLADAVRHAFGQVRAEADAAEVELRAALMPAVVHGDPVLLERLVTNLVENAVRHNVPGGWVEVCVAPGGLTVTNTGDAIPAYDVDELFEPFRQRLGERTSARKGAGLGLSIVRSIVLAHGGSIRAEPRPGGGLMVRVELPG